MLLFQLILTTALRQVGCMTTVETEENTEAQRA